MKYKITIIIALISLYFNANAQFSRAKNKSSVIYRNNYQRMTSSCNSNSSFEIRNGELWTWGVIDIGQLRGVQLTPFKIGTSNNWVSVACGYSHNLALKSDGTLWGWGINNDGEIGDGTTSYRISPIQIDSSTNWISASCGTDHSVGLKSDGTLWTWGKNALSQLGDGTNNARRLYPLQIGTSTNWVSIACGANYTIALKSDGTLWAWGFSGSGALGNGTTSFINSPVQIGTSNNWASIACGADHTMALKSDGTLWTWGYNYDGELGDGTFVDKSIPNQIGTSNNWVNISCGAYHSTAIKSDGTLWAWGWNNYGQLGNGLTANITSPIQISSSTNWVNVACGYAYTLALKADGSLMTWGGNGSGQLGDGTNIDKYIPTKINTLTNWLNITCGQFHTIGLKTDGTLWAWGRNNEGQLGDGTILNKVKSVQLGISNNWVSVVGGNSHNIALKSDGTLWAWGNNTFGQLGDGTLIGKTSPTQIGTSTNWVSISCGAYYSFALKSDGTLWAWGNNNNGQLGDGTIINKTIPTQIGTSADWVSVANGNSHTIAQKSDGTIWGWGKNDYGQLGDSTMVDKSSPVQINNITNWLSVVCGANHTIALKSNGTIFAWGRNDSGQLGDGTYLDKKIPIQIGTSSNWLNIGAGDGHTLAIKSNSQLWSWGSNTYGQLGDSSTSKKNSPIQIGTPINVVAINSNSNANHSLIIKPDRNTICATGYNNYRQLGNDTTTNSIVYVCSNSAVGSIFTSTNIGATFCGNSKIKVSYSTIGPFNLDNLFSVQLSNSVGNFSNPISIGTISSNVSDTIIATIPNNVLLDTGYRIRVVSSSPAVIGSNNGKNITIFPSPKVGFTVNNSSQCINVNNFLFTDTTSIYSGTFTKKWSFGEGINDTSSLNNPSKIYTNANNYFVKLVETSNNNCKDSITKIITVKPTSTSTKTISVCSSVLPYIWNSKIYNTSKTDTVFLTNSVGCDSVTVLKLTIKAISTSTSNLNICPNDLPFLWNGRTYNTTKTDTVYFTNSVGCDSSAILNLTLNQIPVTSSIVPYAIARKLDTASYSVFERVGSIYNWVVTKGTIQSGTGSNKIQVKWNVTGFDTIKVTETSSKGCVGIQKTFSVNISPSIGINEIKASNNLLIYPNPFNETIHIILQNNLIINKAILYDLLGKEIITTNKNEIDAKDLKTGVYLIQVLDNNGNFYNQKLIKN